MKVVEHGVCRVRVRYLVASVTEISPWLYFGNSLPANTSFHQQEHNRTACLLFHPTIISSRCHSADGISRYTMLNRRKVEIPWDLNHNNGDKQAALEAKKKFCADIDAAGRSPSPCAEVLRDDISITEADDMHRYFSGLTDFEVESRLKGKKTRHSSRTPIVEQSNKAENQTSEDQPLEDNVSKYNMDENEDNDDDLYGLTPEAIIEDSMDIDETYEEAQRQTPPIVKIPVILKSSTSLQNLTVTKKIIGPASRRTTASKEIIDVSDDSSSASGSDLEYEKGATEPIRAQVIPKSFQTENQRASRASRSSSKSSSRFKMDQHLSEVNKIAETPKLATTGQKNIPLDFVPNVEQAIRSDVNLVEETSRVGNGKAHLLLTISLPDTPTPLATPVPALSWFPSTNAGVKYHTPFPHGSNASIVPDTIRQPSLTAPITRSTPLMESRVIRGDLGGHIKSSPSIYALSGKTAHNPPIGYVAEYSLMN